MINREQFINEIAEVVNRNSDERLREWRHTTADRIISGLMGNYQSAKA